MEKEEAAIRQFMYDNAWNDYRDDATGEVNYTLLAEAAAEEFDIPEDSDGIPDYVYDLAVDFDRSFIIIDGEEIDDPEVNTYGDVLSIRKGEREYNLFRSRKEAGEAAREYWEDLAENDPSEFIAIVGEDTLVQWALGRYAGPGSTTVNSLEDWLDLWLDTPEEEFARYDGTESTVDYISPALLNELDWDESDAEEAVAYRHN